MKTSKKVGFDNIKGIYGDGDKGLMSSLKTHFPLVPFQLCVVHKEMRMGQLVPVKSVNISKRLSEKIKKEIEKETQRNIEVMWLLKGLSPDHNTISNFRRDNPKAIKKVFRATVLSDTQPGPA